MDFAEKVIFLLSNCELIRKQGNVFRFFHTISKTNYGFKHKMKSTKIYLIELQIIISNIKDV